MYENIINQIRSENTLEKVEFYMSSKNDTKLLLLENIKKSYPENIENLIIDFINTYYSDDEINQEKINLILEEYKDYIENNINTLFIYKVSRNYKKTFEYIKWDVNNYLCSNPELAYELRINKEIYKFKGNKFLENLKGIKLNDIKKIKEKHGLNVIETIYFIIILENDYKRKQEEKLAKFISDEQTLETNNLSSELQQEINDVLKGNYANDSNRRIITFNRDSLESLFSEFQAFHICKGIKGKESLFNKYVKGKFTDKDIFEAHKISMMVLNKYGMNTVNFVMSLPELPFKVDNFKLLFNILDKRRNENENPIIRLKVKNHENQDEEIEFLFLMKDKVKYINKININNKTRNTIIAEVSRNGNIIPRNTIYKENKNNITPILQFFYRITENESDLKKAIISYGLETGKCSVCGKELTDPKSIQIGIGPVCLNYI